MTPPPSPPHTGPVPTAVARVEPGTMVPVAPGLEAAFYPADGPERARVLMLHGGGGVGGSPAMMAPLAAAIVQGGGAACAVLRYRTRETAGPALTAADTCDDAAAALDWARRGLPDGAKLFVLGASYGGFLALDAAHRAPEGVAGLILLNPVTETRPGGFANAVLTPETAGDRSPQALWAGSPAMGRMRCLIVHGRRDDVVPHEASAAFAALWPPGRARLILQPNAAHGYFNRPPHTGIVAGQVRDFALGAAPRRPDRLPEGVRLLYGIGAQKAGTSWLFSYLRTHPGVHSQAIKELHYFDQIAPAGQSPEHLASVLGALKSEVGALSLPIGPEDGRLLRKAVLRARYLDIFTAEPGRHGKYLSYLTEGRGPGQPVVCDITPAYCTLTAETYAEMAGLGDTRFLFLMRDPVGRLWSQIRMAIGARGFSSDPADPTARARFDAACRARSEELVGIFGRTGPVGRADYLRTLRELEWAVPADRILTLFHERRFSQQTADRICAFLGLPPHPIPADDRPEGGDPDDVPEEIEALLYPILEDQYRGIAARFGDPLPDRWRARMARFGGAQGRTARPAAPAVWRAAGRRGPDGPARSVLFAHIPKTAGQTVTAELRRVLGRRAMSPVRTHTQVAPDAQLPPGYRLYAGHLDWTDLETLPEPRFAFTILRDPRERIASFYFYLLREAAGLSEADLGKSANFGKKMISTRSADAYFFEGDKPWQRFIRDHYDNFFCTYLATRRIRGSKQVDGMSAADHVAAAVAGAGALDGVYHVDGLEPLEADLGMALGGAVRIAGNYVNAGPRPVRGSRWAELLDRFESDASVRRIEAFAERDLALLDALGLGG